MSGPAVAPQGGAGCRHCRRWWPPSAAVPVNKQSMVQGSCSCLLQHALPPAALIPILSFFHARGARPGAPPPRHSPVQRRTAEAPPCNTHKNSNTHQLLGVREGEPAQEHAVQLELAGCLQMGGGEGAARAAGRAGWRATESAGRRASGQHRSPPADHADIMQRPAPLQQAPLHSCKAERAGLLLPQAGAAAVPARALTGGDRAATRALPPGLQARP